MGKDRQFSPEIRPVDYLESWEFGNGETPIRPMVSEQSNPSLRHQSGSEGRGGRNDGNANMTCMSCDKFECSEMGPCVKFSYAPGSDEAEKVKAGDLFPGSGAVGEACANLAELCDDQESAARFIRARSNAEAHRGAACGASGAAGS